MEYAPELQGLTSREVKERVSRGETNSQDFGKSRSVITILRTNLLTLFNGVVGGAFLILLILGYWKDSLFGIAVIINILVGVIQEYRSKRILDRLTILNKSPVLVRREGKSLLIRIEELVLDDLIELKAGDQIPADALIIDSKNLEIDESALTGESEPVAKRNDDELFSGSIVTSGSALARVIEVGADTYSSKLVAQARVFSKVSSEIRRALDKVVLWVSWALAPIILIVIFSQLQATDTWQEAVVSSVASVISMVPQGLVLITSIAFAMAATRLATRQVLLQELAAVEGLARVDVVCIDKTGTLTGSAMVLDQVIELPHAKNLENSWRAVLGEFAHLASANSTAKALQDSFPKQNLEVTSETEFSSTSKYSALETLGSRWLLGAPEVLTQDKALLVEVQTLASRGLRVLLLAKESNPVVLLTLKEEIRPEAKFTLEYLRHEGVSIRVLSGDHPETVAGIANAVGLDFNGSGVDARKLSDDQDELAKVLESNAVFGRVTPDQKKHMVMVLQSKGHVVAMIGDGVNDAIALKQSDIGIAMGSGSAATRAVANLVLLDDRFASVPNIIGEGRKVIANVERLAKLFLTKTAWAMTLAIVFGITAWQFPFLPRQLSAIDVFTIGVPAFLIALLPNTQRYEPGFLKRALAFCVPSGIITAVSVILLNLLNHSWPQSELQSSTAMLLSVTGIWVLVVIVRPINKIKLVILIAMAFLATAMFYVPITASFFALSYLSLEQIGVTLLVGAIAAGLIEVVNLFTKPSSR